MTSIVVQPAGSDGIERVWRRTATGGFLILTGRAASLPLGLAFTVLVARALGPESFAHFSVAASITLLAQSLINTIFSHTSVKIVAEAVDWERVGVSLSRLQLLLGLLMGMAVFLLAEALASAMSTPDLVPLLRLLAISVPVIALADSYRNVMVGRHLFQRSAVMPVIHDMTRLMLCLAFLALDWGVTGAVLAYVGASFIQLLYATRSLRLQLLMNAPLVPPGFYRYSVPLALDALGKRAYGRMDLWIVQAISGSMLAGYYSAAQRFNALGWVVSSSLGPLLLATVSHAWTSGERDTGRTMMRQTLRLALCLLPLAALGAGAAPELVTFVYGNAYLPAAPLLAWTSFTIAGLIVMSLLTAMLAAIGRPGAAFAFNTPLLAAALAGCLILVPRIGPLGAAVTITLTTFAVDLAIVINLRRWCGVSVGISTVLRVLVATFVAYAVSSMWVLPAPWIAVKLIALCAAVVLSLFVLGELTRRDVSFASSLVRSKYLTEYSFQAAAHSRA